MKIGVDKREFEFHLLTNRRIAPILEQIEKFPTATAWQAYEEVKATALKAYKEATAPALKAYEEATAPALKAYEEATAPAWWQAYEETQAQRKQTAAEVAKQLRASMHADRQLITNAQQEAKEDARRIDRRVDALVIELTELQRNHTALLVQVQKKAAELEAAEARIRQEARTLAESSLHHGERIAQMAHRVDQVAKSCDQAEQQAAKALSLQDDLPTIRSQLRQALNKLSELEYVAKLRPSQNARRLVAKEIRHVASSAERCIKRFADRLESDIPF